MNKLVCLLFITMLCWSCTHDSGTEKHQGKRNKIVNVRDKVKEIVIPEEDVLIGSFPQLYLMGDYLFIVDYKSPDKLIYLFDKNSFSLVISVADMGQGPGEIARIGHIGVDEVNRIFYVTDHGKQRI
ncbi:MAG: 6-bladed beta-propeller, partial [Tannerella sp.]|nr:6-bladed beta-propeller [Tannerella sp.]